MPVLGLVWFAVPTLWCPWTNPLSAEESKNTGSLTIAMKPCSKLTLFATYVIPLENNLLLYHTGGPTWWLNFSTADHLTGYPKRTHDMMQKGRAGTWEIRLSQSWLPPAGRSWSFHIHCWAIFHSVAVSCTLCYDTLTPLEVKYLVLLQSHIPKGLTRMGGDTIRGEVMTVRESICQRWTAAHYAHDATPDRTAS